MDLDCFLGVLGRPYFHRGVVKLRLTCELYALAYLPSHRNNLFAPYLYGMIVWI